MSGAVLPPAASQDGLLLAVICPHPRFEQVLRRVQAEAKRLNRPWGAALVDCNQLSCPVSHQRGKDLLQRAESMGGQTLLLTGSTPEDALQRLAAGTPLHKIFLGEKPQNRVISHLIKPRAISIAQRLPDVAIETVALPSVGQRWYEPLERFCKPSSVAISLGMVMLAMLFAQLLVDMDDVSTAYTQSYNIMLLFLLASIASAISFGAAVGLITSVFSLCVLEYAYLLHDGFKQFDLSFFATAFIFISTAWMTGVVSSRNRKRSETIKRRERITQSLYHISSNIFGMGGKSQVLQQLKDETSQLLEGRTEYLLPDQPGGTLSLPEGLLFTLEDQAAIAHAWDKQEPSGLFASAHPTAAWHCEPMMVSQKAIGLFLMQPDNPLHFNRPDLKLFKALSDLAALALERADMAEQMERSRLMQERETLRSALLSSVSHDLKTPLASIIGSLSAIRHMAASLSEESRQTLMETALTEAERLNRFITNILDMTRLETMEMQLNLVHHPIDDLVNRVIKRLRFRLVNYKLTQEFSHHDSEILIDATLVEQVLQNLLDNAVKYAPEGSAITLHSRLEADDEGQYALEAKRARRRTRRTVR